MHSDTPTPNRLLAGIKVLEFAFGGAAPLASKMLADFGADVVKVESRTRPDFPRLLPPYPANRPGLDRSAYFTNRNSSKRSIELDLHVPEDSAQARALADRCDVLLTNFRPGVLDKFGLDYDAVAARNRNVIYVRMPMRGTGAPGFRERGSDAASRLSPGSSV